jgi:hypothetical protein
MAKMESYASKSAMKKHEKGEGAKMAMQEKKMGIKDVVAKKSTLSKAKKSSMVRKKGM